MTAERWIKGGHNYPLLPEPTDRELRGNPQTLAEASLIRWKAGHPDSTPPVEVCVEALRVAYRHFNCPSRKNKMPSANARDWAMADLQRFIQCWVSGRPDPHGAWMRFASLYPLTRGVPPCASSETSAAPIVEPLKSTPSPTPKARTRPVVVADLAAHCP